jgi:hypothetical protein
MGNNVKESNKPTRENPRLGVSPLPKLGLPYKPLQIKERTDRAGSISNSFIATSSPLKTHNHSSEAVDMTTEAQRIPTVSEHLKPPDPNEASKAASVKKTVDATDGIDDMLIEHPHLEQ